MRLPTYDWTDDELVGAVDRLLADDALRARMAAIATQIRAEPGRIGAADLIEQVATTGDPVTR